MKDGGYEVAIHGVHPEEHHLSYPLTEEFADKLKKTEKLIKDAIGVDAKLIKKLKKAAEDKKVRLHFLKMSDVIVPR